MDDQSFRAVLQQGVQPVIHEFLESTEESRIQRLMASTSMMPAPSPAVGNYRHQYGQQSTSSVGAGGVSWRTASNIPSATSLSTPSLSNASTITYTSSNHTSPPSVKYASQLLEDHDGVLEQNFTGGPHVFQCLFPFLRCHKMFSDFTQWDTHNMSHFKGRKPPRNISCPYCDHFRPMHGTEEEIWNDRTSHILGHIQHGHPLHTKPDYNLFEHLWRVKAISDIELQELRQNHVLSKPQEERRDNGYIRHQGQTVDGRRERRQHRRGS
ncbi:hypothetical protein M501DRAFT_991704 [Patellaria atrata CBS 101060]|uniref:Uncharacterized protein n=1 Tax=Patellaria atrata CBS 101060 TaxID=1346257 RepID=A0A9P4SDD1_9PEZI|nr:hypothetical protein M501DRAFT_991704 [Patellaria atrata CBS 101060]